MPKRRLLVLVLTGMALALVATGCEFPGPAVTVAFTSPAAGQRIVGARDVTVTGLIGGTDPSAFSLTLNGTPVTLALPTVGAFSAFVKLGDGANTLVATATASGTTSSATLHVYYPFLSLKDGQDASVVLGQATFDTANPGTTISTLRSPVGAPTLVAGNLYVPDAGNNRVVGTTGVPSSNGALFGILLGQPDYNTGSAKTGVDGNALTAPGGVADASGNLVVADPGHDRVLLYQGAPTTANPTARWAVGQTSLYVNSNVCDDVHLDSPAAAFATSGGKLIVADTGHNRVLIWNSLPTQSGVPADLVLGQTGFGTGLCNANPGGRSDKTLSAPTDVWSDGTRLVVADAGNNRVLIWNAFPTTNGQAADVVLGQGGMTTATAGGGSTGLTDPRSASSNGNQLYVADTGNSRVLIWNAFPTTNGQAATVVLGQAGFSGASANRGGPTAANTLAHPQGVRVFDGMAIVADTGNTRELIYRP